MYAFALDLNSLFIEVYRFAVAREIVAVGYILLPDFFRRGCFPTKTQGTFQ
jgi:hypothetical protein